MKKGKTDKRKHHDNDVECVKSKKHKESNSDISENEEKKKKRIPKKRKCDSSSSSSSSSSSCSSSCSSSENGKEKKTKMRKKRRKDSTSTSSSSESSSDNEKTKCKEKKKVLTKRKIKKKSKSSSSSSSSSSSNSSCSWSDSLPEFDETPKVKKKRDKAKIEKIKNEESADVPLQLMEKNKAMVPMTKDEWDKKQSLITRVYDKSTGRHRMIKGDGEVLEEIVSKDKHKEINKQATKGDGDYFQNRLAEKLKK